MVYKITKISSGNDEVMEELLQLWENSVRATHTFLTEDDIQKLKPTVIPAMKELNLLGAVIKGEIGAFLAFTEDKIEMLFIAPEYRGQGFGRKLMTYAMSYYGLEYVDVNEQNEQAVGFYERMGFKQIGRSELDDQGNPFPILHLKRERISPPAI